MPNLIRYLLYSHISKQNLKITYYSIIAYLTLKIPQVMIVSYQSWEK
ncbi:MAG: hypothetical protein BAJALOKI1v1_560016 [Promethearchaeota archaeon]|nr:MAG: hypothetical protein BAJALOKI1v1_560016 [Candidatus Lokiarchaeota archaeon]